MINDIFEFCVIFVMAVATVLAYLQTTKLDINHHPISKLDDILLFIAIPAFIMDTTFTLVPAIAQKSTLKICIALGQIIQVLIQTPFIIDGMRRCSNAVALRKKKPGRELVIFMTISNVSLWIFYTFSVKTAYVGDGRYVGGIVDNDFPFFTHTHTLLFTLPHAGMTSMATHCGKY